MTTLATLTLAAAMTVAGGLPVGPGSSCDTVNVDGYDLPVRDLPETGDLIDNGIDHGFAFVEVTSADGGVATLVMIPAVGWDLEPGDGWDRYGESSLTTTTTYTPCPDPEPEPEPTPSPEVTPSPTPNVTPSPNTNTTTNSPTSTQDTSAPSTSTSDSTTPTDDASGGAPSPVATPLATERTEDPAPEPTYEPLTIDPVGGMYDGPIDASDVL